MKFFRLFDILISLIGLFFLSPLLLFILLLNLVLIQSPIFRQVRLGRNKKPFVLIKFRTMHKNTLSVATHLAEPNSVTSFGGILRRTKLDELPQLWNVLKGDMSVVGPRPGLPTQVNLTKLREEFEVFSVKPGITGLAQTLGIDMSTPELLAKTDFRMIKEMTMTRYFKYIFLTITGYGQGDKVKSKL